MRTSKTIADLVQRFETHGDAYRSPGYNETQLRREFIDPFFEALGWDVANRAGYAEAYKDVIHEDALKVGGATKAPDYCFRIGGVRKFFVEVKKPAVNVKEEVGPAYQLRRYAWSAKLPLSILTDFEEFAVYDCRFPPKPNDKPSVGRIFYCTYQEYLTRWEEIAAIFAKEAVLKGSFDRYAVAGKGKRGTSQVDAEFLTEIEAWREVLARNLALRNPDLSVRDLNFAVQRTIDRILFLRMCEDRGIEPYGQIQALLNGDNTYERLRYLYGLADDRYNSGLFHFKPEKGRAEPPDTLTPTLLIDDKVLKEILRRLYYPESPYEFSVLSADILGNVYEQFLGKVIRLTPGHRAVVEEKPEVKKAGGVYYTPTYIVEYIVKQTVGKLCEGKTPKQIARLRILDPACGSGSFLIGAYAYLLNSHRDWYVKNGPEKHTKEIYRGPGGQWRLTTQEKKRILLNNLYGVDIDSQAVEVTKLSLLLKVLEGESQDTLRRQLRMWRERALPDLGRNIKCGNSLIGPDYYQGRQGALFDDEEIRRVNPFDWHAEFPHILASRARKSDPSPLMGEGRGGGEGEGGFDAVIGNPPYIRIQTMKEWAPVEVELYKQHYAAAGKGNYDIYVVFIERSLSLLNKHGRLGFICPHKFFQAQYGEPLRKLIAEGKYLAEVVHFGHQQVFEGATTYTCLLFLDKGGSDSCRFKKVADLAAWQSTGQAIEGSIPAKNITSAEWNFTVGEGAALFEKLSKVPLKLGDVSERMFQGPITSADTVYLFKEYKAGKKKGTTDVFSQELEKWVAIESQILKRVVRSGSISRYMALPTALVLFPYEVSNCSARLLSSNEMRRNFPCAWEYLTRNKHLLENREKGKFKDSGWYRFGRTQNLGMWEQPKIMVPYMVTELAAYLDKSEHYYFINVTTGGYGITISEKSSSLEYLCGLLNSRLLDFFFKRASTTFHGGYFAANRQYIEQLPVRTINFSDPTDKAKHDKMVSLVERMLDLHKRLATAKNPDDKTRLQRQIDVTDKQIDQIVYELYGLTKEEIAIVEGEGVASKPATWHNTNHEDAKIPDPKRRHAERQASAMAKAARRSNRSGNAVPSEGPALGGPVHGVRERTGEYGPPEDPAEGTENAHGNVGSTRFFDTAEGPKPYAEVAERLSVALARILQRLVEAPPESVAITPEWICSQHGELAGGLFPDWAGRYRDRDVQVGAHTPPSYFEVPVLVRLYCDDLAERLRHVRYGETGVPTAAKILAWADGRFQWIHPFRDFNGRIGRIVLVALIHKLGLPPLDTAPAEPSKRRQYLDALCAADRGDLGPLTNVWLHRIAEAL